MRLPATEADVCLPAAEADIPLPATAAGDGSMRHGWPEPAMDWKCPHHPEHGGSGPGVCPCGHFLIPAWRDTEAHAGQAAAKGRGK